MKKKIILIILSMMVINSCSTIAVLDPRTFKPGQLNDKTVIFGSISLIRRTEPQKLGETALDKNWFSFTIKNIRTGEFFILVELPDDGRYYLALEPGEYMIEEWIFGTEGRTIRCHSQDLYFSIPPQSFVYLGDLVIDMKAKGDVAYEVKDDYANASYYFYERFPGFIPNLSKKLSQVVSSEDYYFYE
jgi:hypothetical protein